MKTTSLREIQLRCSCDSISGSGQYAESIGSSENATNSDTSTAQAIVRANGLNHCPEIPYMKAIGTNTETIENVVAVTASPISSVPSCEALKWSFPISMCRTMFSRTTIASSIRMPMASERPSSDMVLSVNPNAHTAMKLASTEIGSARPVMTVERHEFRKMNTTSTVRMAPSISICCTLRTDASTRSPEFCTTSITVPAGSVGVIPATATSTSSLTCVVE